MRRRLVGWLVLQVAKQCNAVAQAYSMLLEEKIQSRSEALAAAIKYGRGMGFAAFDQQDIIVVAGALPPPSPSPPASPSPPGPSLADTLQAPAPFPPPPPCLPLLSDGDA